MKITVDNFGGSSSGDDESRQVDVEGKDSDVELMDIEPEEKQVEQETITQVSTENYTNGRGGGGGGASYRGSRGGGRMRGSGGSGEGGGRGRGAGQGYQGSFSPTHVTNLSSASSSSGHEDHHGLSADNRANENGGGGGGHGDANEFKETLTRLAANINSGFAFLNTAMEQLRQGQLELYDAKFTLEKICWRNGVYPEFPASGGMMASRQVDLPVGEEGSGRGDVSARARRWHPRMRPSGGGPKPSFKIPRRQEEFSFYNSQLSKEGITKLIKRLDCSLDLKGLKKGRSHAALVLYDIEKASFGKDAVKMEGDSKKKSEMIEEDNQEEDEEEFRPLRKKSKENLPHWRRLRVDPPVMERIMKRLKEFSSSSSSAPQTQSDSESTYFGACGNEGVGDGEEKIKDDKVGEEN